MKEIRFNRPTYTGREAACLQEALASSVLSGDGTWGKRCVKLLGNATGQYRNLLTGSCTHALEMAAMLLDLSAGDEIIMPSYTFVSTANAFVLHGGVPVFVDVDPDTMNIDAGLIESAITDRTRAIAVVHYAGVACDMDKVRQVAERFGLVVIEDAAQGIGASYKGVPLGSIGDIGAFSFHDTKNVTSAGEGGALLVNDQRYWHRARVIRDKGTNRAQFLEGLVDKYSWVDVGSSYLMAELNAAYLMPQLETITEITAARLVAWNRYMTLLSPLQDAGLVDLAKAPSYARHNGHLFFVKVDSQATRSSLISWLRDRGITAPFHYVPLHSSEAGRRIGRFHGEDRWTTREASRLLRLPLYHGIDPSDQERVVEEVARFLVGG